jgi:hypothetical protein
LRWSHYVVQASLKTFNSASGVSQATGVFYHVWLHFIYLFIYLFDGTGFVFLFWVGLGFKLRAKQVLLSLEPYLQFILLWLFWRWGLENYFSGLTLKFNPPNLKLLSC